MLELTRIRSRRRSVALLAAAVAVAAFAGAGPVNAGAPAPVAQAVAGTPDFGPNVTVFDPSMPTAEIQAILDALARRPGRRRDGHRTGTRAVQARRLRHAPRTRCRSRSATTPRSPASAPQPDRRRRSTASVEVYNRCLADGGTRNCLALVNFWRTLSNLSINVNAPGQDGCRASANFWAVSQAVSMRRLNISGGEPVADGLLHRRPAVRQRRLHRRLQAAVRDQRLAAAVADPQQRDRRLVQRACGTRSSRASSARRTTRRSRTRRTRRSTRRRSAGRSPTCYVDDEGDYNVRVPAASTDTSGITWADGLTPGRTIPLSDFYVAKPGDSVQDDQQRSWRGASTCC